MRTFTVVRYDSDPALEKRTVYRGFDRDFSTPHKLVLVQDEDVVDVYAIDADNRGFIQPSMDELLRYFRETDSPAQIIGTYGEKGFLGCAIMNPDRISPMSRYK
jgi:hypothetical protein